LWRKLVLVEGCLGGRNQSVLYLSYLLFSSFSRLLKLQSGTLQLFADL